jgi:hypothetical protein
VAGDVQGDPRKAGSDLVGRHLETRPQGRPLL